MHHTCIRLCRIVSVSVSECGVLGALPCPLAKGRKGNKQFHIWTYTITSALLCSCETDRQNSQQSRRTASKCARTFLYTVDSQDIMKSDANKHHNMKIGIAVTSNLLRELKVIEDSNVQLSIKAPHEILNKV